MNCSVGSSVSSNILNSNVLIWDIGRFCYLQIDKTGRNLVLSHGFDGPNLQGDFAKSSAS